MRPASSLVMEKPLRNCRAAASPGSEGRYQELARYTSSQLSRRLMGPANRCGWAGRAAALDQRWACMRPELAKSGLGGSAAPRAIHTKDHLRTRVRPVPHHNYCVVSRADTTTDTHLACCLLRTSEKGVPNDGNLACHERSRHRARRVRASLRDLTGRAGATLPKRGPRPDAVHPGAHECNPAVGKAASRRNRLRTCFEALVPSRLRGQAPEPDLIDERHVWKVRGHCWIVW